MSWEGANITTRSDRDGGSGRETVEAALNRLSKSYQTAMECVAAWHRADSTLELGVMTRVARAARKALEEGLLWDPLILPHASGLVKLGAIQCRREAPTLTSAAHQDMVKKLAYLALVNLSDLLIAGLPARKTVGNSLLDRGVVPALKSFREATASCWDDQEEQVIRLALVALLDASAVDGSDPTLWLKLACMARRLGRFLDSSGDCPTALLSHRRLEKHALEMGAMALPSSVPRSRLLERALKEWHMESDPTDYPMLRRKSETAPRTTKLVISRYNWPILARTLLRLVRGGSARRVATHRLPQPKDTTQHETGDMYDILVIDLAPIITLPSGIVGHVCSYLEPRDERALEATCKELSFSIVAARAALDHSKNVASKNKQAEGAKEEMHPQPYVDNEERPQDEAGKDDPTTPTNRVSKRLRTQMITEGKRAERLKRRQSVRYCVRAIVSGKNPETTAPRESTVDWERLLPLDLPRPVYEIESGTPRARGGNFSLLRDEAGERLGDSSLAAFLAVDWPISPFGLLFRFVAHVSLHIGNVFAADNGSSLVLTASLQECLDMLLRRSHSHLALVPSWTSGDLSAPVDARLSILEKFSIDVLHAELLLHRVERQECIASDYDSDLSKLSLLVVCLEQSLQTVEDVSTLTSANGLQSTKARFNWLATGYYLCRSRSTRNVSESRLAEREAIRYLDATVAILGESMVIATPHLETGGNGEYRKAVSALSLEMFRNELQASSVILSTQEEFLDAISKLTENAANDDVNLCGVRDIGRALLERYDVTSGAWNDKELEIVDDFVSIYGERMVQSEKIEPALHDWFDSVVPSGGLSCAFLRDLSQNPSISILSILSTCLVANNEKELVLELFSRLIMSICSSCRSKLCQKQQSAYEQSTDDTDDEMFDDGDIWHDREPTSGLRFHAVFLQLLWRKVLSIATANTDAPCPALSAFIASPNCTCMMQLSLYVCAEWFSFSPNQSHALVESLQSDFDLLRYVVLFRQATRSCGSDAVDQGCITGAARIIVNQTAVLRCIKNERQGRTGRFVRQRLAKTRAELLAGACCLLGQLCSERIMNGSNRFGFGLSELKLATSECLLWLWEAGSANELQLKERLLVPVATALVGLSGEVGLDESRSVESSSVSDFFDSDASIIDMVSDDESGVENRATVSSIGHFRRLGQVVHAVSCLFAVIDDDGVASFGYYEGYLTEKGPLLPLVVARVLNRVSDKLLLCFAEGDDDADRKRSLWRDSYPFGSRNIGCLLDTQLYKAYKCLHLVVLTNSVESKDATSSATCSLRTKRHAPESLDAAVALYRCIMRAYGRGRKSPPKAALDTVLDALPPLSSKHDGKSDAIRKFLFRQTLMRRRLK